MEKKPLQRFARELIFAALFLTALPRAVSAHPVAEGAINISVAEEKIVLTVRSSNEEVLVRRSLAEGGGNSANDMWQEHGDYLLRHITLLSDGRPLAGTLAGVHPPAKRADGTLAEQLSEYTLEYIPEVQRGKPNLSRLELSQNVLNEFEFAPGNPWESIYVVSCARGAAEPFFRGLSTRREKLPVCSDSAIGVAPEPGIMQQFFSHGFHHILSGYDHLLFIGGLTLGCSSLGEVLTFVSAFTVAHTTTVVLSSFNILSVPSRIVEPMIAFSIIAMALLNLCTFRSRLFSQRIGVAFFFGLFHGLGFAGGLKAAISGASAGSLAKLIVSFTAGVESGHLLVVCAVMLLLRAADAFPSKTAAYRRYAVVHGSLLITAAGIYYFYRAVL